jgi:hypothetical protein
MIHKLLSRKSLSVTLATLMLTLSVAVPVLERGEVVGEAAIESEHDPGRCGHSHDHRICTQVGANLSVAAVAYDYRAAHVVVRLAMPGQARSALLGTFLEGPPARAPPLV